MPDSTSRLVPAPGIEPGSRHYERHALPEASALMAPAPGVQPGRSPYQGVRISRIAGGDFARRTQRSSGKSVRNPYTDFGQIVLVRMAGIEPAASAFPTPRATSAPHPDGQGSWTRTSDLRGPDPARFRLRYTLTDWSA